MSKPYRCTCVPEGQPAPHSRREQCSANRASTRTYMQRVTEQGLAEGIARASAQADDDDDEKDQDQDQDQDQ